MLNNSRTNLRLPGIVLSFLAILLTGCATAPESVEVSNIEEIAATVTAINQSTRVVSLRGPRGNEVSFQAGPAVQNLAQVEVGDIITLSYEQTYIATRTNENELSQAVPVTVGAAVAEST